MNYKYVGRNNMTYLHSWNPIIAKRVHPYCVLLLMIPEFQVIWSSPRQNRWNLPWRRISPSDALGRASVLIIPLISAHSFIYCLYTLVWVKFLCTFSGIFSFSLFFLQVLLERLCLQFQEIQGSSNSMLYEP